MGKRKGRPGGNPDITKYSFKTDREHPLVEAMTLRMDAPTKAAIRAGKLPDWPTIAREAIAKALKEQEEQEDNNNIQSA